MYSATISSEILVYNAFCFCILLFYFACDSFINFIFFKMEYNSKELRPDILHRIFGTIIFGLILIGIIVFIVKGDFTE